MEIYMSYKIQDTTIINNETDYIDLAGTTAVKVPVGTEAERPTGVAGQLRFNSDTDTFEGYNGTVWGSVAATANYQVFTSSGTWTKPAGVTMVYVEVWGAGGSGGSVRGSQNNGGGGGGGGFIATAFQASDLAATVSVTIGAGGAAKVRTTSGETAGDDGGTSSFGTLSALGGKGGVVTVSATIGAYGARGGNGELGSISFDTGVATDLIFRATGGISGGGALGLSAIGNEATVGGAASWGGGGGGAPRAACRQGQQGPGRRRQRRWKEGAHRGAEGSHQSKEPEVGL
jgi:hypothetical protein